MRIGSRLVSIVATSALFPVLAVAGCQQAAVLSGPGAVTRAMGTVQVTLGSLDTRPRQRMVLGLGFADTSIVAARVTVMGADMVKSQTSVPWDGHSALNVTLAVPAGNDRLFKIEALDANPTAGASGAATPAPDPNVMASIRGVANVTAGQTTNVSLNYNSDAVGRVLETLLGGLAYGFDPSLGTLTDARRTEFLTALADANFQSNLTTFVTSVTSYNAANNTYTGMHPLYFNADYMVAQLIKNGITMLSSSPPLPLEAFRASGTVTVRADLGNSVAWHPEDVAVSLLVPIAFRDGTPAFEPTQPGAYTFTNVPPGTWGLVAKVGSQIVGRSTVTVHQGSNTGSISIAPTQQTFVTAAQLTTITGTIYNESAALVPDGTSVHIVSLDSSAPFDTTVTTAGGVYAARNVPAGVQLRVTASNTNWTTRTRVGVLSTTVKNVVDFGGTTDTAGLAFFLSAYPEVVSTTPAYDASNQAAGTLSYALTLSEPLDATNQTRFANAIRVFPANRYAAPDNDNFAYTNTSIASNNAGVSGANYVDLKDQKISPFTSNVGTLDRPVDVDQTVGVNGYNQAAFPSHPLQGVQSVATANVPWDYSIKNGSLFLNDSNTRATVTWDATGTVATLTFNAPLIADRTNQARYQVALVATSNSDRIVDKNNNQLGLDQYGNQNAYPSLGDLIHATIKQPDLALTSPSGQNNFTWNSINRWLATHQDAARFSVGVDNVAPKLVSVAYNKNLGQSSRFALTFDEPVAAYNGRTGGHTGTSVMDGSILDHFSFAVSDRTGGTNNVNLAGGATTYVVNPANSGALFGANLADIEKEFWLGSPAGAGASAMGGVALPVGSPPFAMLASPPSQTDVETYGRSIATAEALLPMNPTLRGTYLVSVNSTNPKQLYIYVVGVTNVFAPSIVEIKARAEGMPDVAGNTTDSSTASANEPVAVVL